MIICSTSNIDLIHGQDEEGYGKIDGITDWRITNIPSITPGQTGIFSIFNSVTPTIPNISILEKGTVGIGTIPSISSAAKMEIVGSVNITGSYNINNRNAINDTSNYVLSSSNAIVARINAFGSEGYFTVSNNATSNTILSISNNSTPVIGTPSIELIRGTSGDTNIDYKIGNYNGDFKVMSSISNTDTDRMIIKSSGNVGIGTTNPANELHLFDNLTNNTSLIIQNNFTSSYSSNYTKIVPTFVASFTGLGNNVPSTHSAVTATPTDRFMIFTAANVNHTFTVPIDGLSCDILMIGGGGAGGGGGGYYGGGGAGACIVAMNQTLPSGVCIVNVGTGGTSSINGGDSFIKVDNIDRYRAKGGGFSSTVDNVTGTAGGCGGGASYNTDTTTESGGIAVSTNVVNGSTATIGPSITSSYAVMGNMGGSNGTEQGNTGSGGGIGTAGVIAGKGGNGAYEVTLLGASTPINFRNYFANGSTSFGVQDGTSTNYYIGGGGGGYGGNYFAGGLGGAGSFSNSYTSVANTGSGGTGGGIGASGIIIIRYRTETILTSTTITTIGTPSIELTRGIAGDTNIDYKLGNYNGDFKVMSSISNADTDRMIIKSSGNVGIGTTNPANELHLFDNLTNNTSLIIQNNSITVTGSSAPVINPTNVSGGTFSVGQITGSIDKFMIFTAGTSSFTVPAGGMNCDILMIGSGGSSANGGSGAGACIVAINQTFPDGACTVVVGASVGGSTQVNGQDSSISVAGTTRYLAKGGGFVSATANTKGGDGGCGGGASSWNSGGAASGGQAVSTNIVNAIPNIGPTITSTYAVLGNVGGGNGGVTGAAGGGGGIEPNVSSGAGSSGASGGKGGDGAYQVTLSGASTPINFRTYFANNGTFGVQNGTTGNYYIGGGGGGLGTGGSQGNGGLGGGGGVNNAGVVNTGAGGATGGASGSGIVIIRYRVNQTALGNSSIELIRGISSDTNADYKIGNYNGDFKIMSSISNTDTERIIINSTGNVGIGTTNPGNILQVGNSSRLRISNDASDYTRIGTNDVLGTTNTRINLFGNTSASYPGQIDYYATSTGPHIFYTTDSNTERMRITNTGNVGIGTTNPTSKLHVIGTINGTFAGDGASITGLTTSQISGLDTALTTALTSKQNTINSTAGQIIIGNGNGVTTTSTALTFSGTTLTATNFSGNGSGITSLNAGNISGGTLAVARGGTGRTSFDANQILVGNLTQSGNLTWDGNSFYVNGYVRPSAGNGNNGIIFPTDPGGGSGDAAFIKYYARSGEGCTLEIACTNDADDHILLSATGGVGIGVIPATKFHVAGEIFATGNITAYYSDERLKTKISNIKDPLEIINKLNGFYYTPNDLARINGVTNTGIEIGLSAQEVQKVLPEIVKIAPFDSERNKDGCIVSKSGENYLTMSYERLVPVFVEAIKELERKNIELTREIALIKEKFK